MRSRKTSCAIDPNWLSKKEGTESYRLPIVFSTVSAAASFRSRWGSVRGAPVCNSQTSPMAAPQVPQGTDSICFGVSSFDFTNIKMQCHIEKRCALLHIFEYIFFTSKKQWCRFAAFQVLFTIVSKIEHPENCDSATIRWSVVAKEGGVSYGITDHVD